MIGAIVEELMHITCVFGDDVQAGLFDIVVPSLSFLLQAGML